MEKRVSTSRYYTAARGFILICPSQIAPKELKYSVMIDPIVSLAFAMNSSPGVYAVLLGSGVSSAAGVPTGWDMTLDLLRQVASVESEDCEPDPEAWFIQKYNEGPDYSNLLKRLAPTSLERQNLLHSYFEPTEEEREEGKKLPTSAHKSIAKLAAIGAVRVIVTTNFDHLMEQALTEASVAHTVISTPGQATGAAPLVHGGCFVIKPHGDYLDSRFKNTSEELKKIQPPMKRLLAQIFDEFGLVVCGWSAKWDAGLRDIIESAPSRRYTTYWTLRRQPDEYADRIIKSREATVVNISGADSFFAKLHEMVESLDKFKHPHPLSTEAAVSSLKKYIVDDKYRIQLRELVNDATEELYKELTEGNFSYDRVSDNKAELNSRAKQYEALSERLLSLLVAGCYYGTSKYNDNWVHAVERIANSLKLGGGSSLWPNLRLYPALLLLYGGGMAALASGNYDTFVSLLTYPKILQPGREKLIVMDVTWPDIFDGSHMLLEGFENSRVPGSDYLHTVLREPLRDYLPYDVRYDKCFDRFEYLMGLIHHSLDPSEVGHKWTPVGRFYRKCIHSDSTDYCIMNVIQAEYDYMKENHPLLRAGLFNDLGFIMKKREFDEYISQKLRQLR